MPRADGQPLNRILRGQPLPAGTVVNWGLKLAQALAELQSRNKLHRDLQPANILIGRDGLVQLLSSSVATLSERLESPGEPDELRLGRSAPHTRAAWHPAVDAPVRMGAPPYMSPEQVRGEPTDFRSEVFSLGVVLYEMATGKRPFNGTTSAEVFAEIERAQPVPPSALAPDIPQALERVIARSLAPLRSDRYQTALELSLDLEAVARDLEEGTSSQRGRRVTDRASEGSGRGRLFVAGAIVVAALVLVGVLFGRTLSHAPADVSTILVFPVEVRSDTPGAEYLGRSLAEAIAVNLAEVRELKVLPVPQSSEIEGIGALARAEAARKVGAGRLLTGAVTRDPLGVHLTLSLVDSIENRILWGTRIDGSDEELPALSANMARQAAKALGASFPKLYDYVNNLAGAPAMAASPSTSAALGALRRGEIAPLLSATAALVATFPREPDALTLRGHAQLLDWDADPSAGKRTALEATLAALDRADAANPYASLYHAYLMHRDGDSVEAIGRYSALLSRSDLTPAVRAWILRYRAIARAVVEGQPAALSDLEQALRLDPASARTFNILSDTLLAVGRTEEAVTRSRQAVALMPSFWRNHQSLGLALSRLGRNDEAGDAFATACKLGDAQSPCALHALSLWHTGRRAEASLAAEHAKNLTEDGAGAYNLACYWALLGDRQAALRLLKRAVSLGFAEPSITLDPDLESLRNEPEFRSIVGGLRALTPKL
jgi:TolB-like protein